MSELAGAERKRTPPRVSSMRAFNLFLDIDRSCARGLGRQIEDQLRIAIRSGKLQPGRELPSTRALAHDLSISRGVVVRAYAQLAAEGYLELCRGRAPSLRDPRTGSPVAAAMGGSGTKASVRKARYDLRPHMPDAGLFPRRAWLRSLHHAVTSAANADLNYSNERGLAQLRSEVAAYLGRARGIAAEPEQIIITAGCTHSLSLIMRLLARKGVSRIGLENPSDGLLRTIAEHAGVTPIGVSLDRDGILVGELEAAAVPAVIVSAGHQFPGGSILTPARQAALVRWANAVGGLIIEDEYDAALRPDWTPISARDELRCDRIVYLGSTGKALSPAVRLGWAVLPKALAPAFAEEVVANVLQLSAIEQLAFADFLRRGEFDRHLRRMRSLYRQRREALAAAFEGAIPGVQMRDAAAGLNMLIELRSVELEQAAFRHATARGINSEMLSEHTLPGYRGPAGLLIGVGGLADGAIQHVVEELARVLAAIGAQFSAAA
jgi:GntR family transcriptional regulator / MocR family aminotransferase